MQFKRRVVLTTELGSDHSLGSFVEYTCAYHGLYMCRGSETCMQNEEYIMTQYVLLLLQVDLDLGASGAIAIKDKYIITGGKQGPIYIADAANLGGYQPTANNSNVFQVCFRWCRLQNSPDLDLFTHMRDSHS